MMIARFHWLCFFGTCLLTLISVGSADAVLIDNFSDAQGANTTQQAIFAGVGTTSDLDTGLSGVIGGTRSLTINTTSSGGNSSDLTVLTVPQTLNLNTGSGNSSVGTILWNANGAGLGGQNLTAGGANKFDLEVLFADNNLGVQIDVIETAGAGGATATYSQNLGAIGSSTFVSIPFSAFANFINVDFSQVDSISMRLSGPASQDATIRLLQTSGSSVPEPASIALWSMLGLAAATFVWRRKKR